MKKKNLIITGIVILFISPVVYLIVQTSGKPEIVEEAKNTPAASQDIPTLEQLVQNNPSFDNLINLSIAYINNNAPGKSIDHLKKAILLNPKSAIAYNDLGVAYTMLQQYQNGIDACTIALKIDSTFQLAKNNLKWASDEKTKVLTTIAEQEKTPANERDAAFNIEYGLNYFKVGDYSRSIDIWTKVVEADPKNIRALNNIGTAFMMKEQVDDAIAIFKQCLQIDPNDQLAKNNLAWALGEKEKK